MSITVNFNGATLRLPGAFSKTNVNLTGGFPIAPAGIVGIVGEAEAGAPGNSEDIRDNFFTTNQLAELTEKYKSGPILDAFRLLIAPSNDARIVNGANRVYVYKTNASTQATGTLPTAYGTVTSENFGLDQNTINFQVEEAQAEAGPNFANFNYIPDEDTAGALNVRVSGGAAQPLTLPATTTPAGFVSAWNGAISGVTAGGGAATNIITASEVGDDLTVVITDDNIATISTDATWANTPAVGETIYIPTGSVIIGAGSANQGGWIVLSATSSSISAMKLADPASPAVAVGAVAISAATDIQSFAQVSLTYDASTPSGVGAAVEIADDSGSVALEELWHSGSDRELLNQNLVIDGSTISLSVVSGANVTVDISSAFAGLAQAGDIVRIRPGSVLDGASGVNQGNYLVIAATSNSISATKLSGTPAAVAATDIIADTDVEAFQGISSNAAAPLSTESQDERQITININRQSDSFNEDSVALGGDIALEVGYNGTTATLDINAVKLTTSVVGGSGADLDLTLADFNSIQQLADFIAAQTGYSAQPGNNVLAGFPPSILDNVSAAGIGEENAGALPGRVKKDSKDVQDFFDASTLADLSRDLLLGLPTNQATPVFLAGGAKGGTTAAEIVAAIDDFQKVRINSLVPLFSRNATEDILDGLTEPSSTYQISAINAAAKSHVLLMSNTLQRSERNAYVSIQDSFENSKDESNSLASERVQLSLQDPQILKNDGTLDFVAPWGMSAIAAGMQAGAIIGEPMTFKFINISGLRHQDFDALTQADDAIDNGLLFAQQPDQGGFRIAVGNTTYGRDANFVFNRISVLYASDTVAFNLRQQLESIFVGVRNTLADAESIKNTTISILNTFAAAGLIVGDDTNDGTGFKNLNVTVEGNIARVDVTITPVQGIDFILATIVLDTTRQTA